MAKMPRKGDKKSARKSAPRLPDGRVANGRGPAKGAPNAGRPSSAFVAQCREIIDRLKLAEVAGSIAGGKLTEAISNDGEKVLTSPTKNADRIAAIKLLASYGHGLPSQAIDVTTAGQPLTQEVVMGGRKVRF